MTVPADSAPSGTAEPDTVAVVERPTAAVRRRAVVAIAMGNLLEWYDFAVYATLASILGPLFFPSTSASASLLASLSVFAVGYVARPIGALVFGRLSDHRGRRSGLVVIIVLMGVSTVGMGLLPTYAAIGVAAPVLLVLLRVAQGMAIGGEFATATTYLVEVAPPRRRGLYGSITYVTAALGFALGLAVVVVLNAVVTPQGVADGWWRLAFLLSVPLLLIGRYLRRRATESPAFQAMKAEAAAAAPGQAAPSRSIRPMLQVFGIGIAVAVGSYTVLGFVLSYLLVVVQQPPGVAYGTALVATTIGSLLVLAAGHLSDRVGRRPMMLASAVLLAVLAFPAYLLLSTGGFGPALAGQLLLWVPVAIGLGVIPSLFAEMFPARNRTTAMAFPHALVTAIFSGTAPLVSTLLVSATGSVIAPAWYLLAAALLSGAVSLGIRETAWSDLRTH
ncbi:MFS transporter [Pseudonocardia broussonetiae]|uniref:Putative proline/betaine transporter n=1 Tax=Pseudonocardia broussonetiae TaxID=2736640 RepID=A0A6M6JBG6_9PSEU|nr:MFS transporter [Pseudonocardia broussonetiae]QJY44493.1 MFS transporter [Pseudonocardia broussonetiae]